MTAPALFTAHRPIALAIAREWHLPGADHQDVRQEALIALWEAARTHDPARGPFPARARAVIRARLRDKLRDATRHSQLVLTDAVRDHDTPTQDACTAALQRERVRLIVRAARNLRRPELDALHRIVNQVPLNGKADDNARYAVRVKLKAAA